MSVYSSRILLQGCCKGHFTNGKNHEHKNVFNVVDAIPGALLWPLYIFLCPKEANIYIYIIHIGITYSNIRFETYFCFQSHLHVLDSNRIFHNKSLANKHLSNLMAIEKITSCQHHVISLHVQIASCSHKKVSPQSLHLGTPDSSQPASGP